MDAQTETEVPAGSVSDEPFLGPLDIVLLVSLLAGTAWYLLKGKKKESQASQFKSYSIQPTTVNTMTMVENSFIKKLQSSGRRLVVFYGSQTGTAEEFAGRLAKEGIRYQMKGMVADPEECNMEELLMLKDIDKSLAVFCLATYGEGDPTDNCMEFYDWIQNNDLDMTGLNYAVFGLGNKTYEHYNKVGIYVDKRLEELGANRLHKAGGRSCMHVEFDIEGSKMRYEAGDHLAMYPVNDRDLVERLGRLCNAELDTVFSLINTDTDSSKKHPFPCPTTYRTALTHYLEITALPRTHILKELAEYCGEEKDKEFLRFISSTAPDGKAKYQEWVQDSCRNIVHVLEDIPSCHPPIDHVCELLPRLQPRYYSISSSSKLHPTTVHVTAVLVKYETKTGRLNKGVATTFLAEKHPNDGEPAPRVPIFIRKSQFRLPPKPETPVIMVGPGTGLAPFRGFIQERDHCKQEGKEIGQTTLYFGCRKRSEDYIYEDELEDYSKRGIINLRVAFSRDQEKKVYVTHLLEQDSDLIWSVIGENKGHFYICGDAKNMATDVRNILLKVIRSKGGLSETEAQQYIKKMEAQKRYSADVWS
ncbi:AGAP000500-PC [Anopheles gambiae str. PEST]|uniref:NADPH--hemoprotein reductase n=2 Tax=gambiae species complex TaxID=44542 RepID=Q7QFI3_ANOGA|nr:AGAP000500-PA [Anopheles gambiae str. PEST]EGK96434.1 AGAP000500-PC [Anopheles gambiae str. PEST]